MRLKNRFLVNYILVFLITTFVAVLTISILGIISARNSGSLVKNRYTAAELMKNNIDDIEYKGVLDNNGGVQVVDSQYRIIWSKGLNNFPKSSMTASEFTDFLAESQSVDRQFSYSIAYNENKNFWLIVTFPTSIRIDFKVTRNPLYISSDSGMVFKTIFGALAAYLLLLYISTLIYSRLTAASLTTPLRKLRQNAELISQGDYAARIEKMPKNELGELAHAFNKMAERIQSEIDLRTRSDMLRKQLTLDIAHDLKNPLAVIMGYAEHSLKYPGQNLMENLKLIHQKSCRANRLLQGLFELSRLVSPDFQMQFQKMDFAEYVRKKCAQSIADFELAEMYYEFDIPDYNAEVEIDPAMMDRVFENLFDNAIRYSGKSTKIQIAMKKEESKVFLSISDNGKGIPENLAESIFEPFKRVDEARNSDTGGSGLGLSIVKKIIEMHGGNISLISETGGGCRFNIELPAAS